ncbi:non-homologous end-joining DNA ligase [Rhodococcus sp. X156]|uniref:non-homologous end-joining DNA ligase n=1 Tax=Rhodococcus sp. X156 TaxID=2499145 RepID=UPI000FD6BAEA|nr:non-homologous end-joining DNA ligase [Rhodococcus sp. X156]
MPESDQLDRYRAKRDTARTPEPMGEQAQVGVGGDETGPIFVVQEHHASSLHWDLRLEHDGVLASWAVPKGVPPGPGVQRLAVQTEDHPLSYAQFEGEIPANEYGGGWMRVTDRGPVEITAWGPKKVEFTLHGQVLQGRYALSHRPGEKSDQWTLRRRDAPTDPDYEPLPEELSPMLAVPGEPPTRGSWFYEVKWDGYRALARVEGGRVKLLSRSGQDLTKPVHGIAGLGEALAGHEVLLDGELVVLGPDGRPDFGLLQQLAGTKTGSTPRTRSIAGAAITYLIFDLLHLDGRSLLRRPLSERRELLDSLELAGPVWSVPPPLTGDAADVVAAVRAQGLEGVMAKKTASHYLPGRRSEQWLKLVNLRKADVVIGGWQPGNGRRADGLGALLLGVWTDDGSLRYVGNVGTGFTDRALRELHERLQPLAADTSPFAGPLPPARRRTARWVRPELTGEVEFATWTGDGMLRQPRWRGLLDE